LTPLERLLEDARSGLDRVEPVDYDRVVSAGALVVDIRPEAIRRRDGDLPGALVIGLNVLEWRLAPESEHRALDVDPARVVLLVCSEGYSSSLAAHRLQLVGLPRATDLVGGYRALQDHRPR
jgi:rhodanese-related sulfurtransferase